MRYVALVSFADHADFGPDHMQSGGGKRVDERLPDEALYALGLHIYSAPIRCSGLLAYNVRSPADQILMTTFPKRAPLST
jgi:hypothetical protein